VRRQAAHRTAADVQQPGLAGQRLTVLDHPDDVVAALAQTAGREHVHLAGIAVDVGDLAAQPARDRAGVQLGLDHHPPGDDVQSAGEAQQCRHLRPTTAGLGHVDPAQLILDRCRHRHYVVTSWDRFRKCAVRV
jgi:hypothetical protein